MSDTQDHNALPDDELLAAEYALGVLAGTERAAAERLQQRDAGIRARWSPPGKTRLAPWAGRNCGSLAAAAGVGRHIAAALPGEPQPQAGLWQSLAFWRGFALAQRAGGRLSCGRRSMSARSRGAQPLVATIEGGGHRVFVATVDIKRGTVAVVPAAFTADATRVPELWLIPADGKPRPVGAGARRSRRHHRLHFRRSGGAGQEQRRAGGLAGAAGRLAHRPPTGPVIGTGKLTSL